MVPAGSAGLAIPRYLWKETAAKVGILKIGVFRMTKVNILDSSMSDLIISSKTNNTIISSETNNTIISSETNNTFPRDRNDSQALASLPTTQTTPLENDNSEMTIAHEEIFGPVLQILPHKDETEAADDAVYGLSASIESKDQSCSSCCSSDTRWTGWDDCVGLVLRHLVGGSSLVMGGNVLIGYS
ncbi:aldehyde dehydrogenase family protein [Venturia nashicola]|uniref:Aldehyde dehydrogenase family protein n=1 Tax=Venturia nashicola TaxID=86259 RepID=A0A4Z1PG85_9PEZI|nr:aldehyde dehydrogenase family protein [Venturia nashicola]TLD35025.1 aldehyde dehydrogenase family protein [Venturia nashicola]